MYGATTARSMKMEKWFTDIPRARIAMEASTHSIRISEQLQELGHGVIVANVRKLASDLCKRRGRPPGVKIAAKSPAKKTPAKKAKGGMTAAGRKAISDAMKKRHAMRIAAQA
jgi:hypothetical protein